MACIWCTFIRVNLESDMSPIGYIISISTSQNNTEDMRTVLKIAGQGQVLFGTSTEAQCTNLYATQAGKKSKQKLTTQLQAVPGFSKVNVVALSRSIKKTELSEVRKIFADLDWDSSSVSDDELSFFIVSKLKGQSIYYIDLGYKRIGKGPVKMSIKRLEEHPQYSPDWLKKSDRKKKDTQTGKQTHDYIETRTVLLKTEAVEVEPPPPPMPPPKDLHQMTDVQITQWMRKNDTRNLKDEDIEVKRTSEEILITINLDEQTETFIYKLRGSTSRFTNET